MDEFEEPIRILSDLHLAHPGSRIVDAAQLAPLLVGVKTIIFNGDTNEERMKKFRDKAEEHLVLLTALCDAAGVRMVRTRGNHDPYSPPLGAIDLCDGKVFVVHGDVIYPDVSPWSRNIEHAREARLRIEEEYPDNYREDLETSLEVSRRVTQEMEVHQPEAKPGIIGKLKTMLGQAWPPSRPMLILKVWWQAPRLAEEILSVYRPDAEVYVIGHTHRTYFARVGDRVIINTGAFLTMSAAYAVDISGGKITTRKIRQESGEFVLGREVGVVELGSAPRR